jgi:prepilin peptidase CpaA
MSTFISQACLFGFSALLLAAAISDIRFRRIPNLYVLGILILYPVFVVMSPVGVEWKSGLICFGIFLAIGFFFSSRGYFGAGDAKLMAATSLWAGAPFLSQFLMLTALSGGLFAAFFWALKRARARSASASAAEPHLGAEATVAVSHMTLAGSGPGSASLLVGTSTPEIGSTGGEDGSTAKKLPAMELPYGAAIAVGGLAIAAMLLLRG